MRDKKEKRFRSIPGGEAKTGNTPKTSSQAPDAAASSEKNSPDSSKPPPVDPNLRSIVERLLNPMGLPVVTRKKVRKVDYKPLPSERLKRWFVPRTRWHLKIQAIPVIIKVLHVEAAILKRLRYEHTIRNRSHLSMSLDLNQILF